MQLDFQRYITKKINKNERRFSFSLEKDFQTYESWRNSPLFKGFIDYLEDNTYSLSLLNRIYKSSKKYFNIISQKVEIISLIDDKNLKTEFLVNLEGLGTQSLPSYLKMIQKGESYAKNLKEIIKAFQESKDPSTFSPEDAVRPFYYLIRYYLFAFKRITALVAIESSQIKMKKNINKNATEINNNSTDTLSIEDQISQMRKFYIKSRLEKVHKEFLDFEERRLNQELLKNLAELKKRNIRIENKNNSAIVYLLGLSDNYDPEKKTIHKVEGSGPDIDTDFSPSGIPKLIEALQEKKGKNCIARMSTYKPWSLKESLVLFTKIQKTGMVDEKGEPVYYSYKDGEKISKMIPDAYRGRHTKWADIKDDPDFSSLIKRYQKTFNYAGSVDGNSRSVSIHACGVLIEDSPISNTVPLRKTSPNDNNSYTFLTQWEGPELEDMGFIKYDLLSIENLDINAQVCKLIGKDLDYLEEIPLDDIKTFEMIQKGFLSGLWQIEESHVYSLIKEIKPSNLDDLAALVSLIRPGPKDAGLTDDYIVFKNTGNLQNKIHPLLDDTLRETGGVMIYQEQVLKALQILAGMDLATSDKVRRALGKKKPEELEKYKKIFQKGCKDNNGISEKEADSIWSSISAFADYGFNKSHALAYAVITYYNAFLKAHYTTEFMLALMSTRANKTDKLKKYITETKNLGIKITPPCVKSSMLEFAKTDHDKISFGLSGIHGVGNVAINEILEKREGSTYLDIYDFCEKIDRQKVNAGTAEKLAKAGAFDSFGYNREILVDKIKDIYEYFQKEEAWAESVKNVKERDLEIAAWEIEFEKWNKLKEEGKVERLTDENGKKYWSIERPKKPVKKKPKERPVKIELEELGSFKLTPQCVDWEREFCHFYITAHILDFVNIDGDFDRIEDMDLTSPEGVTLQAVTHIKEVQIKNGKNRGARMGILTVEDQTSSAELVLFTNTYTQAIQDGLSEGSIILFKYKLENKDEHQTKILPSGKFSHIAWKK